MAPEAGPGPGPGPIEVSVERRVPRVEEIDWKRRALEAERALEDAKKEISLLAERCATHEQNIESITRARAEAEESERRERLIASALAGHHPIDAALCVTLIERELERATVEVKEASGSDGSPETELAERLPSVVARLVQERPYLFRSPARASGGAAMAGAPTAAAREPIDDALEEARASGGRTQLLRYLRLRRGA